MTLSALLQCILNGLAIGSIYAMIAIGFNIIYNATGVINFAQGEFAMLGGLLMVSLHQAGIPIVVAVAAAVLIVTVLGVLFERLAIRPVLKSGVLVLVLITIGGAFVFKAGAMLVFGKDTRVMDSFVRMDPILFFGAAVNAQQLWVWGVLALVVVLLDVFFNRTMTGKAIRACAVDRTAARLMGINVSQMVMFSFALSAAIGALGGAVIVPITSVEYNNGAMWGLKGFSAAVLGGLGNMTGAVVAGVALGVLESVFGYFSSALRNAIALGILLVVLFIRPSGILGRTQAGALRKF